MDSIKRLLPLVNYISNSNLDLLGFGIEIIGNGFLVTTMALVETPIENSQELGTIKEHNRFVFEEDISLREVVSDILLKKIEDDKLSSPEKG